MRRLLLSALLGGMAAPVPAQSARDSLALALLRFEYVVRDAPAGAVTRAALNQAVDRASLGFFLGQGATAGAMLDSVSRALANPPALARHATAATAALAEATAAVRWLRRGRDSVAYLLAAPTGGSGPVPLLIALHGAGGDERMFFTAYGAGALRREAQARSMMVVTPNSAVFAAAPWAFDSLLAAASRVRPVDASRIYLLGHSMGAGVAWQLARRHGDRVAAVACLAMACGGTAAGPVTRMPPMISRTGALDPIAAPGRATQSAEAARARGEEVDHAILPDEGHTQLVGPLLPIILDWLLARRLR